MKISSPAFVDGGKIPKEFTGEGENHSPPLRIDDVPNEARSLALIMEDVDADSGIFTHWIVFDIAPRAKDFGRNQIPETARQGLNDFGRVEYGGPRPPTGEHRYYFHVYALDNLLTLPAKSTRAQIEAAMKGHILAQTKLMVHYRANPK
jgi:Raf kinase inhibitor-like YbhB/YbcL family protein